MVKVHTLEIWNREPLSSASSHHLVGAICSLPYLTKLSLYGEGNQDEFYSNLKKTASTLKVHTLEIWNHEPLSSASSHHLVGAICLLPRLTKLTLYGEGYQEEFYYNLKKNASSLKGSFPQISKGNFRFNKKLQVDRDSFLQTLDKKLLVDRDSFLQTRNEFESDESSSSSEEYLDEEPAKMKSDILLPSSSPAIQTSMHQQGLSVGMKPVVEDYDDMSMPSASGISSLQKETDVLKTDTVPMEVNVQTINMECCKKVGVKGGTLQLESFGIELEIPPGAIDSEEPQEISLRVLTDTPNVSNMNNEMSVCFGVQCLAPDELVLRLPVTYTIPHCALASRYSSLEAVLYTGDGEYTPDSGAKERIVLTRTGMPNCIINRDVLRLQMNHFSWFWILFNKIFFLRGKKMCCLPFAEKPLSEERMPIILRVHLYDDIKGKKEVVIQDEERTGFACYHPQTEVLIKKPEEDVLMTCFVKDLYDDIPVARIIYNDLWERSDTIRYFNLDLSSLSDRPAVGVNLKVGQTGQRKEEMHFLLKFTSRCTSTSDQPQGQLQGATNSQTASTSPQEREETPDCRSNKRKVMDSGITSLVDLLPHGKYSKLCEELHFSNNYTQTILTKHSQDSAKAYKEVLQEWKDKGGIMEDLDTALKKSDLGGLVHEYKKMK